MGQGSEALAGYKQCPLLHGRPAGGGRKGELYRLWRPGVSTVPETVEITHTQQDVRHRSSSAYNPATISSTAKNQESRLLWEGKEDKLYLQRRHLQRPRLASDAAAADGKAAGGLKAAPRGARRDGTPPTHTRGVAPAAAAGKRGDGQRASRLPVQRPAAAAASTALPETPYAAAQGMAQRRLARSRRSAI